MTTTVYENATVHTLGHHCPRAQALVIHGERIAAVGSVTHCREVAPTGAARVDLAGATVIPGLTDTHIHSAQYARSLAEVMLRAANNLDEALHLITAHAATTNAGWVVGRGWDANRWPGNSLPTKHALDRICPDRPAALQAADGHTTWVNSTALDMLGIDDHTPNPPDGVIMRDGAGDAVGLLRDGAARELRRIIAEQSGDLADQLRAIMPTLLQRGVTSVHDIDQLDALAGFEQLRAHDELPIRVHKLLPVTALNEAIAEGRATGDGDAWIRTGAVKVFTDGALGSHTALMSRPFSGSTDDVGFEAIPLPELCHLFDRASAAGFAVAAHAIGDLANHNALAAYRRVRARFGSRLRHRIEHAQHLRRADVAVFAELGVAASMQPTHCTSDMALADALLAGQDLASYAWASLLAAGTVVAFGSDAPIEAPDPFHGLYAAITRARPDSAASAGWHPEECITVTDALRCYTTAPAYLSGEEHLKGRLLPGMLADFVVLPEDPFELTPPDLRELPVLATVVGGRTRWAR